MALGSLVLMAIICFAVLAFSGLIIFLLKVGVVIQKAGEPPHRDMGTYKIEQGREIKGNEDEWS